MHLLLIRTTRIRNICIIMEYTRQQNILNNNDDNDIKIQNLIPLEEKLYNS